MTWEQKLSALTAISPGAALKMRKPGDWYVCLPRVEIGGGGMLCPGCTNGTSPEAAVDAAWAEFVEDLPLDRVIVISAMLPDRRAVRWNGFMWEDQP